MLNDIKQGNGASTTFNELNVLIKGFNVLISSNAEKFGVKSPDLASH
jgi:hypothetical protein